MASSHVPSDDSQRDEGPRPCTLCRPCQVFFGTPGGQCGCGHGDNDHLHVEGLVLSSRPCPCGSGTFRGPGGIIRIDPSITNGTQISCERCGLKYYRHAAARRSNNLPAPVSSQVEHLPSATSSTRPQLSLPSSTQPLPAPPLQDQQPPPLPGPASNRPPYTTHNPPPPSQVPSRRVAPVLADQPPAWSVPGTFSTLNTSSVNNDRLRAGEAHRVPPRSQPSTRMPVDTRRRAAELGALPMGVAPSPFASIHTAQPSCQESLFLPSLSPPPSQPPAALAQPCLQASAPSPADTSQPLSVGVNAPLPQWQTTTNAATNQAPSSGPVRSIRRSGRNQNRRSSTVAAAASARQGLSSSPGPDSRSRPSPPNPRGTRGGKRKARTSQAPSSGSASPESFDQELLNLLVLIHTDPFRGWVAPSGELIELPELLALTSGDGSSRKPNILANRHRQANTAFTMKMSVNRADRAAGTIDKALVAHMARANLGYSALVSPSDDNMEIDQSFYAWTLLYKTTKDKQARWGRLLPYPRPIEVITWHDVLHDITDKNPRLYLDNEEWQVLILCPVDRPIVGPLVNREQNLGGVHYCLARRAWNGLYTAEVNEAAKPVECLEFCDQGLEAPSAASTSTLPTAGGSGTSACHATHEDSSDSDSDSDGADVLWPVPQAPSRCPAPHPSLPQTISRNHITQTVQAPQQPAERSAAPPHVASIAVQQSTSAPPPAAPPVPHVFLFQSLDETMEFWNDVMDPLRQQHRDAEKLHIRALDTESGGRVTEMALRTIYFDTPPPAGFGENGTHSPVHSASRMSVEAMNCPMFSATVGPEYLEGERAVGPGVARSFATALRDRLFKPSAIWRQTICDGYLTVYPCAPRFAHDPSTIRELNFQGFVMRQLLLWNIPLPPISPFLLALIMKQPPTLLAEARFLEDVSPALFRRLSTWPPTGPIVGGSDPHNLIVESDLVSLLPGHNPNNIDPKDYDSTRDILIKYGALTATAGHLDEYTVLSPTHPYLLALQDGFFIHRRGTKEFLDMQHILGLLNVPSLILHLYAGRRIVSPEQVISALKWERDNGSGGNPNPVTMAEMENALVRLKVLIPAYLRSPGHIQGVLDGVVNEAAFNEFKPEVMRAQVLTILMTGDVHLPHPDTEGRLLIMLNRNADRGGARTSNVHFSTCEKRLSIFIDRLLCDNILKLGAPLDDTVHASFNQWFHMILFQDYGDRFNDL